VTIELGRQLRQALRAVDGSITAATSVTEPMGKPPSRACRRIASALSASWTQ
jgi:hypothetical protein